MNILILGGDGFVGTNVAEVLAENNINYTIASRKNGYDLRVLENFIHLYEHTKPDIIINCVAHVGSLNYVTEQAAEIVLDNTKIILAMYEGIIKTNIKPLVINPIANCAYPAELDTFVEEDWWNGHLHRSVLAYGGTRRMLWITSECFSMQYNIQTISLLVPNMYGKYDSTDPNKAHALNALITKFVKAEKTNQPILEIWGTGIAVREWLYAKDFGKIIIEIIKNTDKKGLEEPLNIAQNFGLSIQELVKLIQKKFDYKGKIIWNSDMPDGVPKKVMDNTKFKKIFPNFEFINLEEGIEKTIDYYYHLYPY